MPNFFSESFFIIQKDLYNVYRMWIGMKHFYFFLFKRLFRFKNDEEKMKNEKRNGCFYKDAFYKKPSFFRSFWFNID